jgi:phage/plasmid primase-like uncharacterized protein
MIAAGIESPPATIIQDGKVHRFAPTPGRKSATAWYIVHPDPVAPVWWFGDWRLDIKQNGEADPGCVLDPAEIAARRKRLDALRARIERDREMFQASAAIEARLRWDNSKPASADHQHLKSKQIEPCGMRVDGNNLLVPMRDADGKLWSLQEIAPDGRKDNQEGGRRKGCFFQIGDIIDVFCIGEGAATCATLHKATGYPVVSAGDAHNLEPVAVILRAKYPDARIIMCGDDDWLTKVNGKPKNVGKLAAEKAAKAIGGALAVPWFNSARPRWATDFNDQAKLYGLGEVENTIRLAVIKHDEDQQAARNAEPPPANPEDFGLPPDIDSAARSLVKAVTLKDFFAYMPMHSYIFTPSREMWPASSINARIPPVPIVNANGDAVAGKDGKQKCIPASDWLDRNKPVEQMTWAPGLPELIHDRLISHGGWIEREGATTFNLYRPPVIELGNSTIVAPWLNHVEKVFGDDTKHIILWLAHRVQRPGEKINHALVLGGRPGIGKDSLLEPVKRAVGPWNFTEVKPHQVMGRFNGFLKSVILRISEIRDSGDVDRYKFYDHMKDYMASPPDVLRVDEKNLKEYSIPNITGVIITTNYDDSLYIPHNDRRHLIAWSELREDDFEVGYWPKLWDWYDAGGFGHVAAYLSEVDISGFDPKAPPPKNDAFWTFVDANRAPEDAELQDCLDLIGNPPAVTISRIVTVASADFASWLNDRKNRRTIPHRMKACSYVQVRNEADKRDGQWRIGGKRQTVYSRDTLARKEQIAAATRLADGL